MFQKTAKYYDLIYGTFKNYRDEAKKVADVIRCVRPDAVTLLDVACGTGEHAKFLTQNHSFIVDGIDLDPNLIAVAREKLPNSKLTVGDMTHFDLKKRYDVITCLFSSIGYVQTLDNVIKTLVCFKNHLVENGVIIVEPWFSPESWREGYVHANFTESEALKICRMGRSFREELLSRVEFQYLVGTKDGIEHFKEEHLLGLFTVEEMKRCFTESGLSIEYDEVGIFGRGLYTAYPK